METWQGTIRGKDTKITPLPFIEAIRFKLVLAKIFGGNAAQVLQGYTNFQNGNQFGVGQIIEGVLANVSDEMLQMLVEVFLKNVKVDGKELKDEGTRTLLFSGNLTYLYEICGKVLEVNYSDLFQMLREWKEKLFRLTLLEAEE